MINALCGGAYAVERATDPLHRARIHTKSLRYLAHALSTFRRLESGQDFRFQVGRNPRPSEPLALCLGPPEAGAHALLDDRAFKLGKDTKHLKHGLAARRRCVDALLMQEQVDTSGMDFRQEAD
jgi:hypothetical protein